jgi:hypothetical protein
MLQTKILNEKYRELLIDDYLTMDCPKLYNVTILAAPTMKVPMNITNNTNNTYKK